MNQQIKLPTLGQAALGVALLAMGAAAQSQVTISGSSGVEITTPAGAPIITKFANDGTVTIPNLGSTPGYLMHDTNGVLSGGHAGTAGTPGPAGPQGEQGPKGDMGQEGPKGDTGVQGPKGEKGEPGAPGVAGATGEAGPQGERGPRGERGLQGLNGETGPQGAPGPQGATGLQGPQGAPGPQGATGLQGPQGAPGPQGTQGTQGTQGATGPLVVLGSSGSTSLHDSRTSYVGFLAASETSNQVAFPLPLGGTISNLQVRVTNIVGGGGYSFTIMNGVNATGISCSIAGVSTSCSNGGNAAVAAGATISLRAVPDNPQGSAGVNWSFLLRP